MDFSRRMMHDGVIGRYFWFIWIIHGVKEGMPACLSVSHSARP